MISFRDCLFLAWLVLLASGVIVGPGLVGGFLCFVSIVPAMVNLLLEIGDKTP